MIIVETNIKRRQAFRPDATFSYPFFTEPDYCIFTRIIIRQTKIFILLNINGLEQESDIHKPCIQRIF